MSILKIAKLGHPILHTKALPVKKFPDPSINKLVNDMSETMFDLMIADEAHKCTGDAGSLFTTCLDESKIKSKRRLFTTATPKIFESNLKKRADERGVKITSMDDEDNSIEILIPRGKHLNVNEEKENWQVETGPIIFPIFG